MGTDVAAVGGDLRDVNRGILLCRQGDWSQGLDILEAIAVVGAIECLPSAFYSFLGFGLARLRDDYREGLELCGYAISIDPIEGDNYLNLARVLLLRGRRVEALGVMNRGLAMSPGHAELLQERMNLGVRRAPVIPFVGRSNPVNRFLGRWRHVSRSR